MIGPLDRMPALALAILLSAATAAPAQRDWHSPRPLSINPQSAEGSVLYAMHCAACHGESGDGRGPVAHMFDPRPTDFTTGTFKLRSTPSGSLPTDDDLVRTMSAGIHGTAMRGWSTTLGPAEMAEVLRAVKSFSPRFLSGTPQPPVWIPPPPDRTLALEIHGRDLYGSGNCSTCHGDVGRGDGPSSAGLADDRGHRAHPFDFTVTHRVKAGDLPQDIYRSLVTGLDGTPMHDTARMSDADRWALVYYLMSISEQPASDLGPGRVVGH